ncbi:hypothetical protein VPG91_11365 [Nitrospirillum amazonense]|uniref:hypothetical protein n=1 Tax=Nitrospirillum amazonense TaxID=28077 RepID=UPI002DD44A38|nr:hypothetical protein [Nitrospirillum amazonense]MEC4591587.1 hypothetical protein [Nitrospirillum amazonense]
MRKVIIIAGAIMALALSACSSTTTSAPDLTGLATQAKTATDVAWAAVTLVPTCPVAAPLCLTDAQRQAGVDALNGIDQALSAAQHLVADYEASKTGDPAAIAQALRDIITDAAKAQSAAQHVSAAVSG